MNSDSPVYDRHRGDENALPGLPSDRYYSMPPKAERAWRAWTKRAWQIATFAGWLAAFVLVLAVAVGIVPMFLGYRTFVVMSGSMQPTIAMGSIVIAAPTPTQNLRVGDVIAFNPTSEATMPIVHRIVQIENRNGVRYFITRGDANTGNDAQLALPAMGLVVITAIPLAGYAVYFAAQSVGTLLLVWIPLVLLTALWLKDRVVTWRQARLA